MGQRRLEAHGPVDPATAWERYAEIAAWCTWSPQIRRVEADSARIAPGTTGVVHALGGLRVPFTVTTVEEAARTWSWVVRVGPVGLTLHHAVHPQDGGAGTVLVLEGPAVVLLGYAPVAWLALRRLVAP